MPANDQFGSSDAGELAPWRLTDLIDVATLQSIQDTFARAFGLPTVIVEPDGTNATEITHRLSFCEDLTRTSPVAGPRCLECDLRGMAEASDIQKPAIFKCWNGLYDCAIPIAPKGKPLGYFLCGQVFTEHPNIEAYRATADEIGVDPDRYTSALQEVRVLPLEQYRASVESMHVLAQMIGEQAAAAMDNFRMLEEAINARDDTTRLMEELNEILEAFSDIGSRPDHRSTLEAIADNLGRLIHYDSCVIYLLEDGAAHLFPVIVRDPYEERMRSHRPRIGEGIVGNVAEARAGRLIHDATLEVDFRPVPGVPEEPEAMLVMPMLHKGELSGVISLSRFEQRVFTEHEFRILSVVASTQAAMAIENARMYERERRMLDQYRMLADLGTALVRARDSRDMKDQLLLRTAEIFRSDVCLLALRKELPHEVEIDVRSGRAADTFSLNLSGYARLAAIRLADRRRPERPLFDAWAAELAEQVPALSMADSILAEPLATADGVTGTLFVAWRDHHQTAAGERRILSVIAGAAGAALTNLAAYAQTDSSLRGRVRELQTIARLAERISGAIREAPIIDEILHAAIELGHLAGAGFAVRADDSWSMKHFTGVGEEGAGVLCAEISRTEFRAPVERTATTFGRQIVLLPLPGTPPGQAAVAGFATDASSRAEDRLLATLARYGAVALENARMHDRQDQVIARLERTNRRSAQEFDKLQKLLGVHKTLTIDVLKGGGLDAVSRSLAEHVGGDVVIVGPNQLVLAAWPPTASVAESEEWEDVRNTITFNDSQDVVVPVMVEGELLAWVLAHLSRPMSEVDRTALEYGALLTALDLLRERTAIEVETRLRGGFVEELFGGDFDEETTLKQGRSLGLDLSRSSRVFLIESASGQTARADIESIYGVLSDVARTRPDEGIVAIRGPSVVAIFPDPERGSSEHVQVFEDQALSTLQSRLPQLPINLAVGTLCDSLPAYKASFQAAKHGLDLLRLLGRSGEVFSFRDSGIEHLLLQATDPHMVLGFVDSFVTPLEEYDSGHSSHLRESLETFYAMGLNLEATARRLHIHVSTLRYRLGKIEELLGIDVRGPQRLDAELALRAATVLSAFRS